MIMILLIDNYDSFTYNIFQYVRKLGFEADVRRNDEITVEAVESLAPSHIIISPGPGNPSGAGISVEAARAFAGKIPLLGICLGHQSIGAAYGGVIIHAAELFHGKESDIYHDGQGIFSGLRNPFRAVRYHSLAIDRSSIPAELEVSAWTDDGEIMGVRHKLYSVDGVQFHPESIGTEQGLDLLANFLNPRPQPSRMQAAIRKILRREDLEMGEAETVMEEIASGKATPAQIGSLLTALALKGESVSEISGFARAMRRKAIPIRKPSDGPLLDTCGTGGDASGTFNISTCAAFVAAGAGATVAKHGNRSITSRCGSADLLEALGVNIAAPPEVLEKTLRDIGLAFLFAPRLHSSMKHAVPVRVEMGIRTIFNILGPLANPAGADRQLIGVFSEDLLPKIAESLVRLGVSRAMVVHGSDGLDEITLTGPTRIAEVRDGWISRTTFHPGDLGYATCAAGDLAGGSLKTNVEIALDILAGERGPKRDAVVINAAAAIFLAGLRPDLPSAAAAAERSIDSGAAQKKLDDLIVATSR
jgi:anthranilate synthase/phosphoribosyltransferase